MKRVWRHSSSWAVATATLVGFPLLAQAGDGPYVGIEGGFNWQSPQDQDLDGTTIDRLHFNRGWEAGVLGGYSFDSGLRPELELSHRRNKVSDGTHDKADAALGNLWYDFKMPTGLFSVVHPYLGGGLGAVRFADNGGEFADPRNISEFGYQAGAGVGFDLSPNLTLSLDYRHLWTQRGGFEPSLPVRVEDRYLAQTALLSVRYSFGRPAEQPVAAIPPPIPAPAPEPPVVAAAPPPPPVVVAPPVCNPPPGFKVDANCHVIDQVIVVRAVDFELNSTRLTLPAQQTLDEVARSLSTQQDLKIEIQGYTDSTGPIAYNVKLSQGRADSVKNYLVDKGVSASSLSAHGYGPDSPIASNSTAAGRAQNRRVTFSVTNAPAHVKVDTRDATPESTEAAEQSDPSKSHR
jgi:OmpA-OmpF porin, OOP family